MTDIKFFSVRNVFGGKGRAGEEEGRKILAV